ncbi:RNI-like protein [Polyporus arcularius HHB13444]|uniref:RNI-like protein n=1 Tax=Polyporus arcularius HHB13444 TaxID=1314778 RepID=A0A5C3PPN6_9APHY|nr:RNI-like protein [Polyporus arcularius HHB13444]
MMNSFSFGEPSLHMLARRPAAPKVSLASRSHIESMDAGLSSVTGAQEVIKQILARRSVTKLILGHNDLGDAGCEELFGFLSSDTGRNYKISQISLNSNNIGNRGLLAISRYLRDNTVLKELFLQNNVFVGDSDVAMVFALAINSSQLEILSLTTNPGLTDIFVAHFFPLLDAPNFHEIHLSVAGLTHQSAPYIVEYISSPRCQLHTLKANGNQLRIRAVRSIIRAARRTNYTLLRLELFATGLNDPQDQSDVSSSDDEGETKGSMRSWTDSEAELKRILTRNATLKHLVEKDALALLRYSRALLLRPKHRESESSHPVFSPCSESCACAASATSLISSIGQPVTLPATSSNSQSLWAKLPVELQLHILSFLGPILSRAQRIRIFTYASSPSTLPTLLPCLSSGGGCIPDPASPQFGLGTPTSGPLGIGLGGGVMLRKRGVGSSSVGGCANGKCMGAGNSVMCRREAERLQWLTSVRCNAFELEDEEDEEDAAHD